MTVEELTETIIKLFNEGKITSQTRIMLGERKNYGLVHSCKTARPTVNSPGVVTWLILSPNGD